MDLEPKLLDWLLNCDEPWTRYRALIDLLDRPESDSDVIAARAAMLTHPRVQELVSAAATWPGGAIKRHNDAKHALHKLTVLAEMGVRADDPGMTEITRAAIGNVSNDGALMSLLNIAPTFGGTGQDTWTWMMCDTPVLLYALLLLYSGTTQPTPPTLCSAAEYLSSLACDNGWRCAGGTEIGKFRGPGKRTDPCPIANVLALKALAHATALHDTAGIRSGAEMLLAHWECSQIARGVQAASETEAPRMTPKPYLFGCGTDYRKLKYPFIWYDLLHVLEALSPYPFVHSDPRFQSMIAVAAAQADRDGRFTAGAMYIPWKGWSFADKKQPSPWLTFLLLRIQRRVTNIKLQSTTTSSQAFGVG